MSLDKTALPIYEGWISDVKIEQNLRELREEIAMPTPREKYQLPDRLKATIYAKLYIVLQAEAYGVELTPELEAECWAIVQPWIDTFHQSQSI